MVSFVIALIFIFQDAVNRPIRKPFTNDLEDDEYGRSTARLLIIMMIIISFLLGLFIT